MKPFNLEEAKAGKPVQTRDGRDVEILRFDLRDDYPIAAIIKHEDEDELISLTNMGTEYYSGIGLNKGNDLFMKSEKKEGWVIMFKGGTLNFNIYNTKQEAETTGKKHADFVTVAKIEWEE